MKKMNRFLGAALVIVLTVALLAGSALAGTITINNAVSGQTYNAYKIFDVSTTSTGDGYAYTINTASAWYTAVKAYADVPANGLTLVKASGVDNVYVVGTNSSFSAADFAAALNGSLSGKTADGTATATGTTVNLTVATAGYYFVDSSLGALCALETATDTVIAREKNTEPTIDKKVYEGVTPGTTNDAQIGDTVDYQVIVKAGGAADTTYIVRDTMSAGLTFDSSSLSIKVGGVDVGTGNYSVSTTETGYTFVITFAQAYTATLEKDTEIVITYSATLNENAVSTNGNVVTVQYGNTTSAESRTTTKTYEFDLVKTDVEGAIIGIAEFELYDALTEGNKIPLVAVTNPTGGVDYYRVATPAEAEAEGFVSAIIEAGVATIKGLDQATYYLEELSAPSGYNLLDARVAVEITGDNKALIEDGVYEDGGVQVENLTGQILPGTGGIGTTIFYAVGGLLAVGALIVLVTKRRMGKNEN